MQSSLTEVSLELIDNVAPTPSSSIANHQVMEFFLNDPYDNLILRPLSSCLLDSRSNFIDFVMADPEDNLILQPVVCSSTNSLNQDTGLASNSSLHEREKFQLFINPDLKACSRTNKDDNPPKCIDMLQNGVVAETNSQQVSKPPEEDSNCCSPSASTALSISRAEAISPNAAKPKKYLSKTSHSPPTDYLSKLPTELLIQIFAKLPLQNFINIAHTNQHLCKVLKSNAATICNRAITARFPLEMYPRSLSLKNLFLVPTSADFIHYETYYCHQSDIRECVMPDDCDNCCWLLQDCCNHSNKLKFTDAGPQFLYLLEQEIDWFYTSGWASDKFTSSGKPSSSFCRVLDKVNGVRCRSIRKSNGKPKKMLARLGKAKIPELIWYFGA